ncbi:hypothetical protein ACH5RR_018691 [Cinchona calisaya]|uniref:Retrotransposon gag domain-containing protein n=1 Tax=Cinchona calisaya TaxID=153742 RepID=A0ABD2ZM66_9GENT
MEDGRRPFRRTYGALQQIVGANTAFAAWERLVQAYASTSKSQIRELKSCLHSLRRDNDSFPIYVQEVKSISDQLAALQSPFSIDDLVECVLDGLVLHIGLLCVV